MPQFGFDMILFGKTKIFMKIKAVQYIENLWNEKVYLFFF